MPESNQLNDHPLSKKLNDLDIKLDKFSSILEKFGLDIITKMGQTNLKVTQLTDKVNELNEATLDVKSLVPQLGILIENQKDLEKEVELLKSLITNLKFTASRMEPIEESIERNETATNKKTSIISQLEGLKSKLTANVSSEDIISDLEKIRDEIFEFIPRGHHINREISQTINRLNTANTLSDLYDKNDPKKGSIAEFLNEKIPFWMKKF